MSARGNVIAVVVGAALAGCTTRLEVLGDDELPLTTCDQVWLRGAPGDPCDLPAPCARPGAPPDPACCTAYAYCRMGALVMDTTCNPDCAACVDDHGCAPGGAVCNAMRCEPCPPLDPNSCPGPCPSGWTTLTRNGCATCECAPPSECPVPAGPCGPLPGDVCYRGARFVPGCAPDDPGCFANACSAPGCPGPAPLGCFTACGPALPNCGQCATTACECDPNGTWVCQAICVDDTPQSLTCFL